MNKLLLCLFIGAFIASASFANYTTPGTGVKFNLDNLVTNSAGDVAFGSGAYTVNDTITISLKDTLFITTDATVKFAVGTFFDVNGTIIINPPTGVLFTAQNTATGYLGMRINANNGTILRKLSFEYAVSLRLSDCNIIMDSCTLQYNNNNTSTAFGNGALALFRANPVITNCKFLNNQRAAIQGGTNGNNAPKIIGCLFMGNNNTISSLPQINLGSTSDGTDTVKIINNQFLRASIYSGAIGFLPSGNVYAIITGNVIKNNRYGISFNGGSNINAIVSYNVIDSNNTQGDPILGGSGLNFTGGSSTSHQNVIVTGNLFRWNLWGVTISPTTTGGGAKPNLGNITNADTTDDGKNQFINNTNNSTTPRIDFYNNNVDDIFAQNNYWGSNNPDSVEARIFHKTDNASLGAVNYSNYILPVALTTFTGAINKNDVVLNWNTASENNSDYFDIEKSTNNSAFYSIAKVKATGSANATTDYSFTDNNVMENQSIFYRLKVVDRDNQFTYSKVVAVKLNTELATLVKVYPTSLTAVQILHADVTSLKQQKISIQFISSDGKLIAQVSKEVATGNNSFSLLPNVTLPDGLIHVRFIGEGLNETVTILKH